MKKVLSVILVGIICVGLLGGCRAKKLEEGKPYTLKTKEFECQVLIEGASRTDFLSDFSREMAETNEIVDVNVQVKLINTKDSYFSTFYMWNNIRVLDENGNEIKPFEYSLPGSELDVVTVEKGETEYCTIPYELPKNTRYIDVDIYQNKEYSNKIRLNIE